MKYKICEVMFSTTFPYYIRFTNNNKKEEMGIYNEDYRILCRILKINKNDFVNLVKQLPNITLDRDNCCYFKTKDDVEKFITRLKVLQMTNKLAGNNKSDDHYAI
ncbi:MAG: hypothetical protein ACOCP8_02025 [archaeon]